MDLDVLAGTSSDAGTAGKTHPLMLLLSMTVVVSRMWVNLLFFELLYLKLSNLAGNFDYIDWLMICKMTNWLQASHLLKYDSLLGTFKADVKIVDNETISVDGKLIKVVSNRDPLQLPWAELGIDIVIEVATCVYRNIFQHQMLIIKKNTCHGCQLTHTHTHRVNTNFLDVCAWVQKLF